MTSAFSDTHDDLRARLRSATDVVHRRLEASLDIDRRLSSRAGYAGFLLAQLALHGPLEAALGPFDGRIGLDLGRRRKAGWLAADLADLDCPAGAVAQALRAAPAVRPRTDGEALGVLYVLEGSTLGGRMLLKRLAPRLGIGPMRAGRFLAAHGRRTGPMWRAFLTRLEAAAPEPGLPAAAEGAALATFAAFERSLAGLRPVAGDAP